MLSQVNPVQVHPSSLWYILILFPSAHLPLSLVFSTKILNAFFLLPAHYDLLDLTTPITLVGNKVIELLTCLFSPASCYFISFTSLSDYAKCNAKQQNLLHISNLIKNFALVKLVISKLKITHRHCVSNSRLTNSTTCANFVGNS